MALAIICYQRTSFLVQEILNTLLCAEVELHPGAPVPGIDHRESVTSEETHMPEGLWNSAIRHDDRDLMECLWKKTPELPVVLDASKPRAWVALDRLVEVGEA